MTYSQTLSVQKNQVYRRGQNTLSFKVSKGRIGPFSTIMIVLTLVSLIGIMYLSQVTKVNSLGYKLSSLETRQSELKKEKSDLEVEAVRLQAIDRVKTTQVAGAMTQVQPSGYAN